MLAASGLGDLAEPETLSADESSLQSIMAKQIERFVAPHVSDAFGARLAGGHADIARHLDLRERHGTRFAAEELSRLRNLLGSSVSDLPQGRKALVEHVQTLAIADEPPVLRHLAETARAQAALMKPLMTHWAGHRWAKIV